MCETQHPKSEYTFVSNAIQWMHEEKSKNGAMHFIMKKPPKFLSDFGGSLLMLLLSFLFTR